MKNFDKAKRERRRRKELTEDQKNEIKEAFDLFDADKGGVPVGGQNHTKPWTMVMETSSPLPFLG